MGIFDRLERTLFGNFDSTRRTLLRLGATAGAGALVAACTPPVIQKVVTRIVEHEKIVDKPVENIVKRIVTATPSQIYKPTGSSAISQYTSTPTIQVVLKVTPAAETAVYTIKSGDTLGEIASRYNVSIDELVKENNIQNPNVIHSGQEIRIPNIRMVTSTPYQNQIASVPSTPTTIPQVPSPTQKPSTQVPTPTHSPTPNSARILQAEIIKCDQSNSDGFSMCTKGNRTLLSFKWSYENRAGTPAEISIFVSPEIYWSNYVDVYYRRGTDRESTKEELAERLLLAKVPVGKEATIKFQQDSGCYDFYISDLNSDVPIKRTDAVGDIWIGNMVIGKPATISVKTDVSETKQYKSVLISGEVYPRSYVRVEIKQIDPRYVRDIKKMDIIDAPNRYSINWVPEWLGTYEISAVGGRTCETITSRSNAVQVRVIE
ncbi:MAG: LysM peptidoglycan-binding domain-containing protein [Candidatus Aenigmarchaeota archaeon]|nr:LysM peptidoglycan-binding domain-containing protein [Candidatus Aenigmarchaeota archaeon]